MNEKVLINNKEYTFVKDYRDDKNLRTRLNDLTDKPMDLTLKNGMKLVIGKKDIFHIHY